MGKNTNEHLHGFEVSDDEARHLQGRLPTGVQIRRHNGQTFVDGPRVKVMTATNQIQTARA